MIDFTSKDFKLIAKVDDDPYWVADTIAICESDYSDWDLILKLNDKVKNVWGFFSGLTMITYKGYSGILPRETSDSSNFDEFNIYYRNILINDLTISELNSLIISENREETINKIIDYLPNQLPEL